MKNKNKIILSSILSIILCACLIAGGSLALFTNKSEVNISVNAAKVEVSATVDLSSMKYYSALAVDTGATMFDENNNGYTQPCTNTTSWTNGGSASLSGGTLTLNNITPGDKLEFNIALLNKSTVKIQYRTVVKLNSSEDENDYDLSDVLVILKDDLPFYGGNTDFTKDIFYVQSDGDTYYSEWTAIETIPGPAGEKIGTQDIKMSVELPLIVRDQYQTESCNINFAIEAIQFNASTKNDIVKTFVKNDLETLNDGLKDSEVTNNTMFDALREAEALFGENGSLNSLKTHLVGIKVNSNIQEVENGFEFAWDSVKDRFLYMKGDTVIYPTENIPSKYQIFKVKENYSDTDGYSVYLQKGYNGSSELEITTGLDVGDNENISKITYARSDATTGQDVVIRTNSYETELTVNAPNDVIRHYDVAGSVNIIEAHTASYHEYGKVPFVEIAKGRIALEKGAEVEKLHFDATTQQDFDQIIVAADPSVTLPEFSRDEAVIKEKGTLVVELQKDTNNDANTDSDYVWLYKQGVISQIVVSTENIEGIEKDATTGDLKGAIKDSSEFETLQLGVTEKAKETQKAAVEIANNYTGSHYTTEKIGGKENVNVAELDENGDIKDEDKTAAVTEGGKNGAELKKNAVLKVYNSVAHLGDGETFQFEFDGENVVWTSSDPNYITVDNNGLVTVVNGGGEATITATMGDQSYSCNITTWYFHNGNYEWYYSTAEIANAKQWINMTTCYESSYAGYYYFFGNYKLINDIDFTDVNFYNCYYYYSLDLDGNGHKISNISACNIFGNYYACYWDEGNKIHDLTIENCDFQSSGIGYGAMGYSTDKLTLTNVDMNNCVAYSGSYFCYAGTGTLEFKDCDVSGATITGGTGMSIGGFCGQWHTSGITIDTCTFEGSITAVGNQASGFVTMHNSAKATIKNSEIKEGTIIKNVSTGAINAFSNDLSSDSTENTFNGYAKTAKTVTADDLTKDIKKGQWETIAVPKASDFKLENGILTYVGNSQFTTAKVYQSVSVERYDADEDKWYSSYEWNITPSYKTSNLVNGKQLAGFETIEHIYNLVGNDEELDKCFLSVSDRTVIDNAQEVGSQNFYLVGNTAYLEAKTYESGSYYVLTGTRGETAPESIKVTVHVIVYDGTEEAGSISLAYNVSETK